MNFMISTISILISVAFYTILERKLLSYMQIRKGPNKVGMMGILQPFSDAIKLFNKNIISNENMNFILSYFTPASTLTLTLIIISIIPFMELPLDNKFNVLTLFILSSLMVYSLLLIGWSANSKFSHLGAIRSIAQMISYEVSFFLMILFICLMSNSYNFSKLMTSQPTPFAMGNMIIMTMWLISCLAETNRSPFDFAEGESELVSGFNVEYMGGWFALIFLAEYASMIILVLISSMLFMGLLSKISSMLFIIFLSLTLLWVRGTLPRFRYDMLMKLTWKILLPLTIFISILPMTFSFMF